MFVVTWWFGCSFDGHVADGWGVQSVRRPTLEAAKEFLTTLCKRQRCLVGVAADGMSAGFENWNGSPTGGAKIEEVLNN